MMILKLNIIRKLAISSAMVATTFVAGCNFQPLYSSPDASVGSSFAQLSNISVSQVKTRQAQQVRNHLIFLLSGGISPVQPSHEVRLTVTSVNSSSATEAGSVVNSTVGTTAGKVTVTVSYDLFDASTNKILHSGRRIASAGYDKTTQSFANQRAVRDAENRASKEAAEQIRLAIASQLSNS